MTLPAPALAYQKKNDELLYFLVGHAFQIAYSGILEVEDGSPGWGEMPS